MAANLKLASARDGKRSELAAAIEGVARAEAAVAAARASCDAAQDKHWDAQADLEKLREANGEAG